MDKLPITTGTSKTPLWTFAVVLVITFTMEGAIMLLLPLLPTWSTAPLFQGMLDASALTLTMAPVIWWLVVKPLRQLSESRGKLLHFLFQSQEQERSRIARDLHDGIGQQLTALTVGLGTVESARDLSSAQKLAHDLREVGAAAHEEVRRIVRGLRPGVLEELGLAAAIERLCEDFQAVHGVTVRLQSSAAAIGRLPSPVEVSLYRILQEALTNVARHAQADVVRVALTRTGDSITVSIEDNGIGMRDASGSSSTGRLRLGLDSIRERTQMLHGECTIQDADGGGTLVRASIPISE